MLEVGRAPQFLATAAAVIMLGWLGFSTIRMLLLQEVSAVKTERLAQKDGQINALEQHRGLLQTRLDKLERFMAAQRDRLSAALQRKVALQQRLLQLNSRLKSTLARTDEVRGDRKRLVTRVGELEDKIRRVETKSSDADAAATQARRSRQDSLQMIIALSDERDRVKGDNQKLTERVGGLEWQLRQMESRQRTLVAQLEDKTDDNIAELEAVVRLTGLPLNKLLGRVLSFDGIGGPLITLRNDLAAAPDDFDIDHDIGLALNRLEGRIERWSSLNDILARLPLAAPMDNYRISSSFGRRKDPFNKKFAAHNGLDFVGKYRASVYATAPGVVKRARWSGAYGRMVVIDHGSGVETAYGHLRKFMVKEGEKVRFRQVLGQMGSSGRSTGSHLHYEIRFQGRRVNPYKFIKAGTHVFKK